MQLFIFNSNKIRAFNMKPSKIKYVKPIITCNYINSQKDSI